jgi:hypothetical protein
LPDLAVTPCTINARVAAPATVQIDPFKMMTSATQLPTEHFADYSFVFKANFMRL